MADILWILFGIVLIAFLGGSLLIVLTDNVDE